VAFLALAAAAALIGVSRLSVERERQASVTPLPTEPPPQVPVVVPEGRPVRGDPDAPVKIVEFFDFYCSFCARYLWEVFPRLERDYIQTGLVRYEVRNFIVHGSKSLLAAVAAECAQEQGKFWPFHEKLFEAIFPGRDISRRQELDAGKIKEIALDVGLDVEKLDACLEDYEQAYSDCLARYNDCVAQGGSRQECLETLNLCLAGNPMVERVLEDRKELRRLLDGLPPEERKGLKGLGTPLFFINDRVVLGLQPYEKFRQAIEQELAEARAGDKR